jgi:hypothetical protein
MAAGSPCDPYTTRPAAPSPISAPWPLFELGDGVAHAVMTLARTRTGFFEDGSFRARARTAAAATRLSSTSQAARLTPGSSPTHQHDPRRSGSTSALPDRLVRSWMAPQRARPCFRMSTDLAIRRCRVSSVLAPSTCSTCHDLLL